MDERKPPRPGAPPANAATPPTRTVSSPQLAAPRTHSSGQVPAAPRTHSTASLGAPRTQSSGQIPAPSAGAAPARTVSNPGAMKAMTAAREKPLAPTAPQGPIKDRLKSEASNAALNVVSVLKETWEDFRRSDRYFKYKAAIIGAWVAISLVTVIISRPHLQGVEAENDLQARVVVAKSGERIVYMLENESKEAWTNIEVIANGTYRAKQPRLDAGDRVALTAKSFRDGNGKPPPDAFVAQELELKTAEGHARLIEEGAVVP